MRGHDHGATLPLPLVEDVEQPDLAARVECAGRLVQEQDARLHGDDGGDRDALLLAAGQGVGRPVQQLVDAQVGGDVGDEALDLVPGEAELQGAEGELVAHVGAEELHVGVLEDEADAGAEVAAERRVLERLLGERSAEGLDVAGAREDQSVEHLEQRRLARPVRADDATCWPGRTSRSIPARAAPPVRYSWLTPRRTKSGGVTCSTSGPRRARACTHRATLVASQSQSPGPTRIRRRDGIVPV